MGEMIHDQALLPTSFPVRDIVSTKDDEGLGMYELTGIAVRLVTYGWLQGFSRCLLW